MLYHIIHALLIVYVVAMSIPFIATFLTVYFYREESIEVRNKRYETIYTELKNKYCTEKDLTEQELRNLRILAGLMM